MDIFFCSEETAKLTFLKQGDVYEIMKSFAREYPISIVASTQRIVHSPKVHTFGSVIYNAKEDKFYQEEPYRNIEVVDRSGAGMLIFPALSMACWRITLIVRKLWSMETPQVP